MTIWQERVEALVAAGYSLASIGRAVGLTRSAVNEIAKGRTAAPRGEAAIQLYKLHQRLQRKNAA